MDSRDGQVYKTITIGEGDLAQTWMAENLNYSVEGQSWCGGGNGKMEGGCSVYGRLYTWDASMDKADCAFGIYCRNRNEGTQGICPSGWHIPRLAELEALIENAGGTRNAGLKLVANTSLWNMGTSDDSFGFAALPAGYHTNGKDEFLSMGNSARFWSSSEEDVRGWQVYYMLLDAAIASNYKDLKYEAFSVRCIKNVE